MSLTTHISVEAANSNYVTLSTRYNNIIDKCEGRDFTAEEEAKLLKIVDTYGSLFGVNRVTACEEMRLSK